MTTKETIELSLPTSLFGNNVASMVLAGAGAVAAMYYMVASSGLLGGKSPSKPATPEAGQ